MPEWALLPWPGAIGRIFRRGLAIQLALVALDAPVLHLLHDVRPVVKIKQALTGVGPGHGIAHKLGAGRRPARARVFIGAISANFFWPAGCKKSQAKPKGESNKSRAAGPDEDSHGSSICGVRCISKGVKNALPSRYLPEQGPPARLGIMKTVFCIDDNPRYLLLLKVAARSLRALHGDDVPLLCVYGGDDDSVIAEVKSERIPLAHYKPRLNKTTMPVSTHAVIGCFLRLELALVPELADDNAVLYCDTDTFFLRPLDQLFRAPVPAYLGMAREATAPFYNVHEQLDYLYQDRRYSVRLPFPIWTYSSAVVLFNLERLRRRGLAEHLLAFSQQNVEAAGNLDQSLLNYFFGKRITRLEDRWNRPPYQPDCLESAHIVHFHGPKAWEVTRPWPGDELRINHFAEMRRRWYGLLTAKERTLADSWG